MGLYSSRPPAPPDYAAATREGVEADIDSLPLRKLIESAARQGTKVSYTDMAGKEQTVDFTGFGDVDMSRQDLEFAEESADRMAQAMLSVQEKYGADFVKQRMKELELADPKFREVRDALGGAALEDVESGYKLAPRYERRGSASHQSGTVRTGQRVWSSTSSRGGFRGWQRSLQIKTATAG